MVLKLIYSTASPFSRKVRIALAEKGIPVELQEDIPWTQDTQTTRWNNPLRQVPILVKHNGTSVYGSPLILEWIEAEYPPPNHPSIYPQVKEREILAKQVQVLADGIAEAAALLYWEQHREHPSTEWTQRQRNKLEGALKNACGWLSDREFIMIGKLTVADIAMGSTLAYLRLRFPEDWKRWGEEYPEMIKYTQRLEERESFKSTVLVQSVVKNKPL